MFSFSGYWFIQIIAGVERSTLNHKQLELGVIQESISDLKEGTFLALGSFESIFGGWKNKSVSALPANAH